MQATSSYCSFALYAIVVSVAVSQALLAAESGDFQEVLVPEPAFVPAAYSISEDAMSGASGSLETGGYYNHAPLRDDGPSCSSRGRGLDYFVIGRAGADYFSVPGESLFGGLYGADLVVRLSDDWGFVGSANASHVSGGTQFVGSTGLVKLPNYQGSDTLSQTSCSLAWDQFTDSRVQGLYLNQLRFQFGYSPNPCIEVGVLYSEPTNQDNDVLFTIPGFPGFTAPGTMQQSRGISGYAAGRIGCGQWATEVGYRRATDSLTVGGSLRLPLSWRVATFTAANYQADPGSWGVSVGLEFFLGPSSRRRHRCHGTVASCDAIGPQGQDSDILLAAYQKKTETLETPPDTKGSFQKDDLNLADESILNQETSQRRTPASYEIRYTDYWLGRSLYLSHGTPGDCWINADLSKPGFETWPLQAIGSNRRWLPKVP